MVPAQMTLQERPPYVQFEVRSVEDRAASITQGHWVGRDEHFAIITPSGSKDRVEREVSGWLTYIQLMANEGRFRQDWVVAYKGAYEAWKNDEEVPLAGSPLRNWPPISPAQYKQLRLLRILTVEDLAAANEETINRIGMGARSLKARAQEWLSVAANGAPAEELASLKATNQDQQAQITRMAQQMADMAARMNSLGIVGANTLRAQGSSDPLVGEPESESDS